MRTPAARPLSCVYLQWRERRLRRIQCMRPSKRGSNGREQILLDKAVARNGCGPPERNRLRAAVRLLGDWRDYRVEGFDNGAVLPGAGVAVPGAGVAVPGVGVAAPGVGAAVPGAGAAVSGAGVAVSGAGAAVPGAGVALGLLIDPGLESGLAVLPGSLPVVPLVPVVPAWPWLPCPVWLPEPIVLPEPIEPELPAPEPAPPPPA